MSMLNLNVNIDDMSSLNLGKLIGISNASTVDRLLAIPQIKHEIQSALQDAFPPIDGDIVNEDALFLYGLSADDRIRFARLLAVLAHRPVIVRTTKGRFFAKLAAFCGSSDVITWIRMNPIVDLSFISLSSDATEEYLNEISMIMERFLVGRMPPALQARYRLRADTGNVPSELVPLDETVPPAVLEAFISAGRSCFETIEFQPAPEEVEYAQG